MAIDERHDGIGAVATQPFAWKHFLVIVIGTILIIAAICAIATLGGKQEASFSSNDPPKAIAIV